MADDMAIGVADPGMDRPRQAGAVVTPAGEVDRTPGRVVRDQAGGAVRMAVRDREEVALTPPMVGRDMAGAAVIREEAVAQPVDDQAPVGMAQGMTATGSGSLEGARSSLVSRCWGTIHLCGRRFISLLLGAA